MAQKSPKPLVAGNWKMNGTTASLKEARLLAGMLKDVRLKCEVMICPPATLITTLKPLFKGTRIRLGGQDCHWHSHGAHTGDISPEMLEDAGCSAVIIGHSERRTDHGEIDDLSRLDDRAQSVGRGYFGFHCHGALPLVLESGHGPRLIFFSSRMDLMSP